MGICLISYKNSKYVIAFFSFLLQETLTVKTVQFQHKMLAFADDILLFINNSNQDMPVIMETITRCATCSGLKINYDKSESIKYKHTTQADWTQDITFKKAQHYITYLGIKFTSHHTDTYKLNINYTSNKLYPASSTT